jgi:uncharacterized protein (DUF488 family)
VTEQEQTVNVKVVTTGVYGFSEEEFFQALQEAGVDTFVDIRQRRGLRGSTYAFANSKRLQARLADLGIRYLHRKDLAPTKEVRQRQKEADKASGTAKRQRTGLSQAFVDAYREEILDDFDPQTLLEDLPPDAAVIALFCVEREPEACHRSLVAEKLQNQLNLDVEHITP